MAMASGSNRRLKNQDARQKEGGKEMKSYPPLPSMESIKAASLRKQAVFFRAIPCAQAYADSLEREADKIALARAKASVT